MPEKFGLMYMYFVVSKLMNVDQQHVSLVGVANSYIGE
jgi:hypothetical protein